MKSIKWKNYLCLVWFYQKDYKTQSAVEKQLGIIGKAVNRFSAMNTGYELKNSREIVNIRNRMVHAYDSINNSIVCAIKSKHLPVLKFKF